MEHFVLYMHILAGALTVTSALAPLASNQSLRGLANWFKACLVVLFGTAAALVMYGSSITHVCVSFSLAILVVAGLRRYAVAKAT